MLKPNLTRLPRYFYAALAVSVFLFALSLINTYLITDQRIKLIFSDLLSPCVNVLVTLALIVAAKKISRYSKPLAWAWGIFGLARLLYSVGDVIWAYLEVVLVQSPYPSVADILYLAYYPLFVSGVLLLPHNRHKPREWSKRILDIAIVMIAAFLVFWNLIIGPMALSNSGLPLADLILSLAYPVGDLVLVGALLALVYQSNNSDRGAIILLVLSTVVLVITDTIFGIQSLVGTYAGGDLLDAGWILADLLLGLAGVWQCSLVREEGEPQRTSSMQVFDNINNLSIFFPYFWLSGALGLLIYSFFYPMPMDSFSISIGVTGIIELFLVRHIITHFENRTLFNQLVAALGEVQQKTTNLEFEIGEKKRAENQIIYHTLHDGLTGLPNRVLLLDRLRQALEYTRRRSDDSFSILLIDVDYFNRVNDSLGHAIGDVLLIAISQRLKEILQSSDTLARLGGDEFIILLESTGQENTIIDIANHVGERLKVPFYIEGHEIFITTSIGIVSSLQGYLNPFDILRDADIAMYQAKMSGKACYEIFKPEFHTQAVDRRGLEIDLRHAVEFKEFELYYQPIFSLQPLELISFEALIRWHHPVRGLLSPDVFIPIAEESKLVIQIGDWVLYEACTRLKEWQTMFPVAKKLSMHVNISGEQLKQPNFVNQLEQVLDSTGIDPDLLKLEITESVLVENQNMVINGLFTALRGLGAHLQIDDFGTGYSSLSYLQHIPVDMLKIDKSFVRDIGKSDKALELVRAIVSMAKSLGINVIAEGIETEEHLAILKTLDCKYGQGYLFSKPIDRLAAEKIIKNKDSGRGPNRSHYDPGKFPRT